MVVITDISVPAAQFALGQLFEAHPDVDIEVERLVPLGSKTLPLFWVRGVEPAAVEQTLRIDPLTEAVTHLSTVEDRHLFAVEWSEEVDAIVEPLRDTRAEVLRAQGDAFEWQFRLQFADRNSLIQFRKACAENEVSVSVEALYNPKTLHEEPDLSDEQLEVLLAAYRLGFWDVPRQATLAELAETLGISSNAASQRMRRALKTLVGDTVASAVGDHAVRPHFGHVADSEQ